MQWLRLCTFSVHAHFFEIGNCLDIKIMFDVFMTTALLQECLIKLRQQGLADTDSALQLTTRFCFALMFSSANPVARPRSDNEARYSTRQLIGRSPLLIPSRHGRVFRLFSHSRIALQKRRHAGENL
jgi:hypothetical protein